jgi:site-specific recombinase XerD
MTDLKSIEKLPEITDTQWETVNLKNRKLMADFLKQSTNLSDQTLKQYESALRIFFWYLKENCEDKHLTEVRPRDFLSYQNYLVERGMSSSGVRLKRSAVSSLNSYTETYYSEDFPNWRSFINKKIVAPPANFVHEKEPLNLEEYKHLCEELLKQEKYQVLAYVSFSFSTGARRAEVRQLLKEVTSYEGKVFVSNDKEVTTYLTHALRAKGRGKIGKVRKLQFDSEAMKYIKLWLEFRGEDDCPFVFATKRKGKMEQVSENTFNLWGKNYVEPIVGRRFHPHLLRESRATTLTVEQGKDINIAQKLLGHNSSETTRLYVIRKDSEDSDGAFD